MKEICFITQCSLPVPTVKGGAVETLVEYIINENEKQGKYHFTVISVADNKAKELTAKYRYTDFIYVNPGDPKRNKWRYQIYRVLKHLGIYIPFSEEFKEVLKLIPSLSKKDLYIYEAGPTTQLPALSKRIPKEKLLVHIHWDGMSNKRKDKSFSRLLPVSDYIGEQWRKGCGCSKEKITPLYNCANIERFIGESSELEKENLKKKLNIPLDHKIIIFTGRVVADKGIKELLMAYHQLKHEKVTLLIIGSAKFGASTQNKQESQYEAEVAKIIEDSSRSIVFTGFIHQSELYKYYNIADVAVMPSMFQDPAPLVCIETQVTGTPLIATNVGGIKEYANPEGVILIDKDEKMIDRMTVEIDQLLDDPERCKKMGDSNKKYAMQFNTTTYFEHFCKIIDEV